MLAEEVVRGSLLNVAFLKQAIRLHIQFVLHLFDMETGSYSCKT